MVCRTPLVNAAPLLLPLLLGACSIFASPESLRGNRLTEEQVRDVVVGVQTKADVQALFGSPTSTSTFADNEWYYISSRTHQRPARALAVSDQETVVVQFDQRGVVRNVRRMNEADMRPVPMVARETPVPGNDRTLLQALFGNVGRIGPGAAGSGTGGGTGLGASSPGAGSGR